MVGESLVVPAGESGIDSVGCAALPGVGEHSFEDAEVQGIDPSTPGKELPLAPVVTSAHPGIYLQVGAFADADNANRLAQRLRDARLGDVQVTNALINGQHVRRVRVGPLDGVDSADQISSRIEGMGLPRPQVAVD